MNDPQLQQRINYLVQHGGLYPEPRPKWLPWAIALVALQALTLVAIMLA